MAYNFCEFCGKPLENGKCTCTEWLAANPTAAADEVLAKSSEEVSKTENPTEEQAAPAAEPVAEAAEPVAETPATEAPVAEISAAEVPAAAVAAQKPAKKKNTGLIIGLIAGGVALLAAIGIVIGIIVYKNSRPVEVDISEYIEIKCEGYETIGKAYAEFDEESFRADYADQIKYNKEGKKYYKDEDPMDNFVSTVTLAMPEWEIAEDLSNGDEVTFEWEYLSTYSIEGYFNVILSADPVTVEAEGLTELGTIDLFEDITVTFEGTAPVGYAKIERGDSDIWLDYTADKTTGLSNGDKVTVTVDYYGDLEEYCIEEFHAVPEATTKEFTVEGLETYVLSSSEIDDNMMKLMTDQADAVLTSGLANAFTSDIIKDPSFECIGNYFLVAKDLETWGDVNKIVLVYVINIPLVVEGEDQTYNKTIQYYYGVGFDNLKYLSDGTPSVDVNDYTTYSEYMSIDTGIPSSEYTNYALWMYGYEDIDDLAASAVVSYSADYDSEDNIDESKLIASATDETSAEGDGTAETEATEAAETEATEAAETEATEATEAAETEATESSEAA